MPEDSKHHAESSTASEFAPGVSPRASQAEVEDRRKDSATRPREGLASLGLASVLLVSAMAFAFWLTTEAPEVSPNSAARPDLSASADYSAYGGDAYTGIQNAAVDTEVAVIAGANALSELAIELDTEQAEAAADQWHHLWLALAALIVTIGAVNFNVSLQRFLSPRSS